MAAQFSERDLLLLSNFAYFAPDKVEGRDLGSVIDAKLSQLEQLAKKNPDAIVGGDIKASDAVIMLQDMKNSPNLTQLRIAKQDAGVEAICYEVPGTKQAVVAFQGTGGSYDRWKDNAVGLTQVDTDYRRGVERFARECSEYSNITTTGHSKGGHGAEHFAVVSSSNTQRVVSFDGYGVSPEYQKRYSKEIEAVQGRITSINGDNDYIQGLDGEIAHQGNISYVKGTGNDFKSFHRSSDLYFTASYDANGNVAASSKQSSLSPFGLGAKHLANKMINELRSGWFSLAGSEAVTIVGIILGIGFGKGLKQGLKEFFDMMTKSLLSFGLTLFAIRKIIKVVRANWAEILAVAALYAHEAHANKQAARVNKVAPLAASGGGFGGGGSGGGRFTEGDGRTKFTPEQLENAIQALLRIQGALASLGGQVRGCNNLCGWRLSNYRLSSAVSLRVEAAGVGSVQAGALSQVLSGYGRLLAAYGDEISRLRAGMSEALRIFEQTERELVSLAQGLQTQ